jgi:hypothetical protein
LEIRLPSGREVRGKVPNLKRALHYMGLLEKVSRGDMRARLKLFNEFPKEVGLERELNELTVEEFFDVVNRFFARRGSIAEIGQTTSPPELSA